MFKIIIFFFVMRLSLVSGLPIPLLSDEGSYSGSDELCYGNCGVTPMSVDANYVDFNPTPYPTPYPTAESVSIYKFTISILGVCILLLGATLLITILKQVNNKLCTPFGQSFKGYTNQSFEMIEIPPSLSGARRLEGVKETAV